MGSSTSKFEGQPVVLILGCGYAGSTLAKLLEAKKMNVVIIDRKNYFLHNVASLRATASEEWAEKIIIPTNNLLKNGVVVHAEIHQLTIDPSSPCRISVRVGDRDVRPDYLVIATGSSYAFPAKVPHALASEALTHITQGRQALQRANNVLIIGGGPVGIELAGEIAHFHPTKRVTLINSHAKLLEGYGMQDKVSEKLLEKLQGVGVTVIQGDRVRLEDGALGDNTRYLEGARTLTTEGGKTVQTDLIYFCVGAAVNNRSYQASLAGSLAANGRLNVNEYLQVQGFDRVFALGDCANIEAQLAWAAGTQAATAAQNIYNLAHQSPLTAYTKLKPAMLVPVGPKIGAGQLPMGANGKVIGDTLVPMFKGKDLFAGKYWKDMGAKMPKRDKPTVAELAAQQKSPDAIRTKKMTLQEVMSIDAVTADRLAAGVDQFESIAAAVST